MIIVFFYKIILDFNISSYLFSTRKSNKEVVDLYLLIFIVQVFP